MLNPSLYLLLDFYATGLSGMYWAKANSNWYMLHLCLTSSFCPVCLLADGSCLLQDTTQLYKLLLLLWWWVVDRVFSHIVVVWSGKKATRKE